MTKGKVGFIGGKFYPFPHLGHVYAMIRASTMVDELHVIVSYDTDYEKNVLSKDSKVEHVDYAMRLRWWTQLTKDLPHVHVHAVYEQQTGEFEDWINGAVGIVKAIGKNIDVVFSSEHSYTPIFKKLYPWAEHVVLDSNREAYPISGTKIRDEGVMKNWHMIPKIVQPYFAKKVVVVGTESCGKSTLVKNLANLYNTSYVEEYGRTYYEKLGGCDGITMASDYSEIAFEHKYHEKMQLQVANKVLFIDTEATVTRYFLNAYLNQDSKLLREIIEEQDYDLWIFLEPDVKWVDDGTRTFGEQDVRENNNEMLKSMLDLEYTGKKHIVINGSYQERLEKAVHHINELVEMKGL